MKILSSIGQIKSSIFRENKHLSDIMECYDFNDKFYFMTSKGEKYWMPIEESKISHAGKVVLDILGGEIKPATQQEFDNASIYGKIVEGR